MSTGFDDPSDPRRHPDHDPPPPERGIHVGPNTNRVEGNTIHPPDPLPPGWYVPEGAPPGDYHWWDGRAWDASYPTAPRPGQPVYEQAPKKKRRIWLPVFIGVLLALVVFVVGCVALVGAGLDEAADDIDQGIKDYEAEQARQDAEAMSDVALDPAGCTDVQFGGAAARGTVTNGSAERSNYVITVVWEDGTGRQLDAGIATVLDLEPGQPADWEARAVSDVPAGSTCRVSDVDRTASS